jgi:hypothetical protein
MTVKTGEKLLASDMLDLTFFPVGMIMMMDGSWQDGRGGWYICDGRSTPYGQTPNLQDKFIKGTGSTVKEGGSNSLTAAMLPKHKHSIYTDTTKNPDRTVDKNLSGYFGSVDNVGLAYDGIIFKHRNTTSGAAGSAQGEILDFDGTHNHTGQANDDNSVVENTNTNNMPSYYSVIYIKKMTGGGA